MGGDDFLLDASHGQHIALQRDLSRHGKFALDGGVRQQRTQGHADRDTSGGAVFGRGSGRYVYVKILLFEFVGGNTQRPGLGVQKVHRRHGGFLHHLSQLAREHQIPTAGHGVGLDKKNLAARLCPGKACRHAGILRPLRRLVKKLRRPQKFFYLPLAHINLVLAAGGNITRHLATDLADLALQVSHAGFAGIMLRNIEQTFLAEADILFFHARIFHTARNQVTPGNFGLFAHCITAELQHFHAVKQRRGDWVEHVGRGDKNHTRQVEGQIEIVIGKGIVLRRVQHFEQGRSGIAAEVAADFVDLVKHDQRVFVAAILDALDDAPGHGADIGPTMPADFGLVVHTAHAHAIKLTSQGARDGLAQRGLTHAGRPHEAQDGPADFLLQFHHGQMLQNAFLHVGQVVVVFIQDALGLVDVDIVFGGLVPGQAHEPVQISPRHGILGRCRMDRFKTRQFLLGHLEGFFRHIGFFNGFAQFGQFRILVFAFSQLLLDRLHLLAQHIFTLTLVHLAGDLGLDFTA